MMCAGLIRLQPIDSSTLERPFYSIICQPHTLQYCDRYVESTLALDEWMWDKAYYNLSCSTEGGRKQGEFIILYEWEL